MNKDTPILDFSREATSDALTQILREGARKLLLAAVEDEIQHFLKENEEQRLADGRAAVVRNGYLPQRDIQTGIGKLAVRVPKVRDRSKSGIKFNSALLPPYLRRTKQKRDMSDKRYVYWWADGIYSNVRMDDKICLLVIIGATEDGHKELVAVEDGFRESTDSWSAVFADLQSRGLKDGPSLATGDGALGFWKALTQSFPKTRHQRCWAHKTANVLGKLPKSMQEKVKGSLHEIWMAESRMKAEESFDLTLCQYEAKYAKAMGYIKKDREELLSFYNFPAEHWGHIRTSNPIESAFSSIGLRTAKTRNCGSRETTLSLIFKLAQSAEKRWRKLKGYKLRGDVVQGIRFKDGIREQIQSSRIVA